MAMARWLRRQFAENHPYDEFAREVLTARGSTTREGPAGFFKTLAKPEVMSRSISQLFLGVRIECAQCHHHQSEKWDQDDYLALAGFFFLGAGALAGIIAVPARCQGMKTKNAPGLGRRGAFKAMGRGRSALPRRRWQRQAG